MNSWRSYWLHLRPRSWPIVFAHYACGALIMVAHARPELRGSACASALFGGLLWTVCLNGGTLALNSAFDRDQGDIGYLDNPPPVPRHLALLATALLLGGTAISWAVPGPPFFWLMAGCVALSLLYSVPPVRLKAVGGADLLVNMLGYGAATFAAGALATNLLPELPAAHAWRVVAGAVGFGFLFGAFYPMTQIYQMPEDRARGDRTLVIRFGPRRSLALALAFELVACASHLAGVFVGSGSSGLRGLATLLVLASGAAWGLFTLDWLRRTSTYPAKQGMYRALRLWALSDALLVVAYGILVS